jgi:type I restriction enzyme, R subunit
MLDARNRAFHRLLVDGVTVEYRADGSIRGAQARLVDFDDLDNNEWLAVNQFTEFDSRKKGNKRLESLRILQASW